MYDPLIFATCPHNSDAILALASSLRDRKMRMRSVCKSARQASDDPNTERSEEMDCVATIGMQRHCWVSAKDFSSPDGSSSPTDLSGSWVSCPFRGAASSAFFGPVQKTRSSANGRGFPFPPSAPPCQHLGKPHR